MARSSGIFGSYDYENPGEAIGKAGSDIGNNLFKVALLSKQLEQEHQNKLAEMEQAHKLTNVSPEQAAALAGLLKVPKGALDELIKSSPEGVSENALGHALAALGMQARGEAMLNKPQFQHRVGPDGTLYSRALYPDGTTGPEVSNGLDPKLATKVKDADASYTEIKNNLKQYNDLAQKVLSKYGQSVAGVQLDKIKGYLAGHGVQIDPETDADIKTMKDVAPSIALRVAKIQDGTVRGMFMGEADLKAIAGLSDTLASGIEKAKFMDSTLDNRIGAVHQYFDPSAYLNSPLHPKVQVANAAKDSMESSDDKARKVVAQKLLLRQQLKQKLNSNGQ